jgi:hypothetical protein
LKKNVFFSSSNETKKIDIGVIGIAHIDTCQYRKIKFESAQNVFAVEKAITHSGENFKCSFVSFILLYIVTNDRLIESN